MHAISAIFYHVYKCATHLPSHFYAQPYSHNARTLVRIMSGGSYFFQIGTDGNNVHIWRRRRPNRKRQDDQYTLAIADPSLFDKIRELIEEIPEIFEEFENLYGNKIPSAILETSLPAWRGRL